MQIQVPDYWKGSIEDVLSGIKAIRKGHVTELLPSASGRPIHMVEYGQSHLPPSRATLSSALGAHDYRCYADKTGVDYRPTLFFAGCIHGGEFEGTAAIMNLIKLLETGSDYAGDSYPELVNMANQFHLILLPMCNPDGRSHIPFDNFVGHTFEDLRYYNQGTWKDGTLCGWPGCKQIHPIKDYVDYLGGYFNDDGVNMMHDDFFGHAANETQNVLDMCRIYAPDISVLFHGGDNCRFHLTTTGYVSGNAKKGAADLIKRALSAFETAGLPFSDNREGQLTYDSEWKETPISFNLTSAMHHCCGGTCLTFESNQGLIKPDSIQLNNREIYDGHLLFMRCIFDHCSKAI